MDKQTTFDSEFYLATLRTAQQVGMSVIPKWRCAQILAILQVFGNNEGFTLSTKFNCDRQFIQETYHIQGGETPDDLEFIQYLKDYIAKYETVKSKDDPVFIEAKKLIKERYNFDLYV